MEVIFELVTRVLKEVDHGSLLDEIILIVETNVLDLLFGVYEMAHLLLFDHICPLRVQLLSFVASIGVVEDGKLGTGHEDKVARLNVAQVEGDKEFVVEDHTSDPLVVRPASEAGDRNDRTDVAEHKEDTTA